MLKKLFIFTLLSMILVQVCTKTWVVVYYEYNKEYIAKNLCENRDRPELKCHGKCKLMQLMEKEREKERNPLANIFESINDVFCEVHKIYIVSNPIYISTSPEKVQNFSYLNVFAKGVQNTPFHPPSFLAL